jgi:lysophospholipase L1-like esterase
MPTFLNNGQTILFIGDSITECDRRMPIHSPLGWGYVRMFSDILSIREPEKQIRIINKGINENTIAHLLSRWCDDVIEFQPDVLFVLIGINDVTRYLDHSPSLHRSPEEFKTVYRRLVEETNMRVPHCEIILMQPFFISRGDDIVASYRNQLITTLVAYIQAIDEIANEYGLIIIKLSEIFRELIRHKNTETYSEDKIHPNLTGHLAIAETIYRGLQFKEHSHV